MRAFGAAARRILVKAATGSPKNITPKAEVSKSKLIQRGRGGIGLPPIDIGEAGGTGARSHPQPASARRCPAPRRGRKDRRRAQIPRWARRSRSRHQAPARQARGAAKASKASVTGVSVMSVCACRATQVWPPLAVPEGKHVGVDLIGCGHSKCPAPIYRPARTMGRPRAPRNQSKVIDRPPSEGLIGVEAV